MALIYCSWTAGGEIWQLWLVVGHSLAKHLQSRDCVVQSRLQQADMATLHLTGTFRGVYCIFKSRHGPHIGPESVNNIQ